MVNLSKEELEERINWYEKKYGPYIEKKGIHNWKNLFRKPTLNEWVILILMITGLFMGWAYSRDTALCRETIEKYGNYQINWSIPGMEINFSEILKDINETGVE